MASKSLLITSLLFLLTVLCPAQYNYIGIEGSIFQVMPGKNSVDENGLFQRVNRGDGTYFGASYHFSCGRNNSFSLGIGLSNLFFQKETQGIFPETNQYGLAVADHQIRYWTFPLSFTWLSSSRSFFRHGIRISYVPSVEGSISTSITTFGGAEQSTFRDSYQANEQAFQHSLRLSFPNQLYLGRKSPRITIEPYAGIGSGYFRDSGTSVNTISFGIQLAFAFHPPRITIERERDRSNAAEKKRLLEQKQREINEQLNKKPK